MASASLTDDRAPLSEAVVVAMAQYAAESDACAMRRPVDTRLFVVLSEALMPLRVCSATIAAVFVSRLVIVFPLIE